MISYAYAEICHGAVRAVIRQCFRLCILQDKRSFDFDPSCLDKSQTPCRQRVLCVDTPSDNHNTLTVRHGRLDPIRSSALCCARQRPDDLATMSRVCPSDAFFGPGIGSCRGGLDSSLSFEESILGIIPQVAILLLAPLRLATLRRRQDRITKNSHLAYLKTVCTQSSDEARL